MNPLDSELTLEFISPWCYTLDWILLIQSNRSSRPDTFWKISFLEKNVELKYATKRKLSLMFFHAELSIFNGSCSLEHLWIVASELNYHWINTKIAPNYLMWKFCGNTQFPQGFGRFAHQEIKSNFGISCSVFCIS